MKDSLKRNSYDQPAVLFLAVNSFPPSSPEAIANAKLVISMLKAGWDVDIITRDNILTQQYPSSVDHEWKLLRKRVVFSPCINKPNENGRNSFISVKLGQIQRILSNLSWILSAYWIARSKFKSKRYDFILSRSIPISAHLVARLLVLTNRVPWIANWNDPEPWCMLPPPYGEGAHKKPGFVWRFLLGSVAKAADWSTFPCERLRQYMCSYITTDLLVRSSVIPHIGNVDLDEQCTKKNDLFTICHAGNLNERDPTSFLEGLSIFLSKRNCRDRVRVEFIGVHPGDISQKVQSKGLEDVVVLTGPKSYDVTMRLLKRSTVLLIIEAMLEEGIFLPSKFVDYTQVGRPIFAVSPPKGTVNDLITEYGGGSCVNNKDPESVAEGIEKLFDSWEKTTIDKDYNLGSLRRLFDNETILSKYMALFNGLSQQK